MQNQIGKPAAELYDAEPFHLLLWSWHKSSRRNILPSSHLHMHRGWFQPPQEHFSTMHCIRSTQCSSRGTPVYAYYDGLSRLLGDYVTIQRWADIVVITHYTHHCPRCRTRTLLLGLLLPLAVPFLQPAQLQNLPSAVTMKLWV